MAKKAHVGETPATQFLRKHGVAFVERPYEYREHGGALHSASALGLDPFHVVKTLVMQDQDAKPLVVLMPYRRKTSRARSARSRSSRAAPKSRSA